MKPTTRFLVAVAALVMMMNADGLAQADTAQPETVMVTLHVKAGAEADMQKALDAHWAAIRELNMVAADAPHVTLRGAESGDRTYFVEIFTWRDATLPDHAPAAVHAIWNRLNALVESRNGEPGLKFTEMRIVTGAAAVQ